jgi:hypothetical protein
METSAPRPKAKAKKVKAKSKAPAPKKAKKGKTLRCGATSAYTPELAAEVCKRIASGKSLRTIGKEPGMPCMDTIIEWENRYPAFATMVDRAREHKADRRVELMDDLADRVVAGTLDPHRGRVAIDHHKWIAARENFRRWGDKQAMLVANAPAPAEVQASSSTKDELLAEVSRLALNMRHRMSPQQIQEMEAGVSDDAEIIPPERYTQSDRERLADHVAGKARPPTIDNEPIERGEPVSKGRNAEGWDPPPKAEFQQLKCTNKRPEGWGPSGFETKPEVLGNSYFERFRR